MSQPEESSLALKELLFQIAQDSQEHHLSPENLEAIWAMGLSAFLTGKGFGLIEAPSREK